MKQVLSRGGAVEVEEVPVPIGRPGTVVVRTAWSLVSSGTEKTDISGQRVLERLRRQPEVIGKVWREVTRLGVGETVRLVRDKLDQPVALGNSLAGIVAEVGDGVTELIVGDRVACSGTQYAHHADYCVVPKNLVAKVPGEASLRDAAFVTLGAIALQGVRRASVGLGERVVVVGLGLIGLLTVQLLRAAGARVAGVDPVAERVEVARHLGADLGVVPGDLDVAKAILAATEGQGADAVLLTAATASSEPVNQAFEMTRERGRVVIVGDVGLNLARSTFYRREQDLLISRSTGPGRYDPAYEDRGIDYPYGHVRWTERRNMEAFLGLLAEGSVKVEPLIGGEYAVTDAPAAYASLGATTRGVALLLRYEGQERERPVRRLTLGPARAGRPDRVGVAVIGAGEFARQTLLPILATRPDVRLRAIVGGGSGTGLHHARRFGAETYGTDSREVLEDPAVDAVVIATRHDLHAPLAIEAAQHGKAVFVEKPLALTPDDCRRVLETLAGTGTLLTVGFNRRFAPLARRARALLARAAGPLTMAYRINAQVLPDGHWLLDPAAGGGRLVGEGCHFLDLLCWLANEDPEAVYAVLPPGPARTPEEAVATLRFPSGSVGVMAYTRSGHPTLPKERLEVFRGGTALVLDDLRTMTVNGVRTRSGRDEKGYEAELDAFLQAIRGARALEVSAEDGARATLVALAALTSGATGTVVRGGWREMLA